MYIFQDRKYFTKEETRTIIIPSKETGIPNPLNAVSFLSRYSSVENPQQPKYLISNDFLSMTGRRSICMKVVFWNAISESDNVTGYVAAVGTILSLEYHCEVVLSSNYISNHMLQDCYSGKMKEEGLIDYDKRQFRLIKKD